MSKRRSKYSEAPRHYKRYKAQRYGRSMAAFEFAPPPSYNRARAQRFIQGRDRTGGYYGRYTGRNAELKFLDTDVDDAVVASVLGVNEITIIPQGDSESERIGRKITIKSIHVKGTVKLEDAATSATATDCVTCMLIQDKQTNGAAMTAAQFLEVDDFESFRNLANSGRFRVLYTHTFVMKCGGGGPTAGTIWGGDVKFININKKCNIPIEYDNSLTTGVVSTVRSNNVYWCTMSENNVCILEATVRVRYSDH